MIDDFDPSAIADWWNEIYEPYLISHKDVVYDQVWSKIVERDDEFMPDTCEAGEVCKQLVSDRYRKEVDQAWGDLLASIKAMISGTVLTTENMLE